MNENMVLERNIRMQSKVSCAKPEGFRVAFLEGSSAELEPVLKLRYRVFNLEMNEGLLQSHLSGKDEDRFDRYCDHLVIYDEVSGEPVGTYRLQTSEMAGKNIGFYSATEFDFTRFPDHYVKDGVEIGRACVVKEHRNIKTLFLLWKGLLKYLEIKGKRFLFGCTSLMEPDTLKGWRAFDHLCTHGFIHPEIFVCARPDFSCGDYAEVPRPLEKAEIPRLLRAYLNLGARICSEPALDRAFGTIDFLTLLDIHDLDDKTFDHFSK